MHYDDLTKAQKQVYNDALTTPGSVHRREIEMHVLDLDGNFIQTLDTEVLDTGSYLTLDVTQTPMVAATLAFVERTRSMVFEPQTAGAAPIHRQFMIRVNDSREIPGLGWVDCYVFTGPIWDFDRVGPLVNLTCHSMDRLALGTIRRAKMWRRKTRKTTIMRELLQEAGAVKMIIPDLPATTPVHVHVGVVQPKKKGGKSHKVRRRVGFEIKTQDTYWDKASGLADSENRLLYPSASGVFIMRSHPERASFHFKEALLADVDLMRPGDDGPNTWLVTGGKPKGSKHRVSSGLVGFPKSFSLSAWSLQWNGVPNQILDTTQNPHCKTKAKCRAIAIRKRNQAMRMITNVSFDAVPIPWLVQPWALVTAEANWGVPAVYIEQLTYPLSNDTSPMTVGSVKQAVPIEDVRSVGVG